MITREDLENAAFAVGLPRIAAGYVAYHDELTSIVLASGDEWRPHLDDGDSRRLQLAVRATLSAFCDGRNVAEAWCYQLAPRIATAVPHDGSQADAARAAREAVVLCAAAVGERMKGGA